MTVGDSGSLRRQVGDWILMDGDRYGIAAVLAIAFFIGIVAISIGPVAPVREVIEGHDSLWQLFSPLAGGVITMVTLVVMFNQLVLSQELGALGDQRKRMEGSLAFRSDLQDHLGRDHTPVEPSAFLALLVAHIGEEAAAALSAFERDLDATHREFLVDVEQRSNEVHAAIEEAEFGNFGMLSIALDYEYSLYINRVDRLVADQSDATTALEHLESMRTSLEFFGPAREHLKTMYFQWVLVTLSRTMLYTAVPALFVAVIGLTYIDATTAAGTTLGVDNIVWAIAFGTTIVLVPFFILFSFVLRIATVARRTLPIGQFVLRPEDRRV